MSAPGVQEAKDEIRDRLGLARRWLSAIMGEPTVARTPNTTDTKRLDAVICKFWVESTRGIDLDELGRHVTHREVGLPVQELSECLSRDAVRAIYLLRQLRERGLVL